MQQLNWSRWFGQMARSFPVSVSRDLCPNLVVAVTQISPGKRYVQHFYSTTASSTGCRIFSLLLETMAYSGGFFLSRPRSRTFVLK